MEASCSVLQPESFCLDGDATPDIPDVVIALETELFLSVSARNVFSPTDRRPDTSDINGSRSDPADSNVPKRSVEAWEHASVLEEDALCETVSRRCCCCLHKPDL